MTKPCRTLCSAILAPSIKRDRHGRVLLSCPGLEEAIKSLSQPEIAGRGLLRRTSVSSSQDKGAQQAKLSSVHPHAFSGDKLWPSSSILAQRFDSEQLWKQFARARTDAGGSQTLGRRAVMVSQGRLLLPTVPVQQHHAAACSSLFLGSVM
jgi:hypothetical protein